MQLALRVLPQAVQNSLHLHKIEGLSHADMDWDGSAMNRQAGERESDAVAWFVRLQDCDDEALWIAHRDWLEADPANVAAFATVERIWIKAEGLADLPGRSA